MLCMYLGFICGSQADVAPMRLKWNDKRAALERAGETVNIALLCLQVWPGAAWTPGHLRLCPMMAASPFTKSPHRSSTKFSSKGLQHMTELDSTSVKAVFSGLPDRLEGSHVAWKHGSCVKLCNPACSCTCHVVAMELCPLQARQWLLGLTEMPGCHQTSELYSSCYHHTW